MTPPITKAEVRPPTRVVSARVQFRQRFRDIFAYRELLGGLVRKELKVKYKNSVLGFLWSMLNPALYLVVFYVVFQVILKNGIPQFAIFLLSGLLVWNLFATALPGATGAVVGNAGLVKKVAFPREILALSSVGAALVHFFLQGVVLLVALVLLQRAPSPEYLAVAVVGLLALLVLTSALGVFLSAVNVYLRDAQHLLELLLLAWFWATPIVYPYMQVAHQLVNNGLPTVLYRLNPITPIVLTFQRALYNQTTPPSINGGGVVEILPPNAGVAWYLVQVLVVLVVSLVLFCGAMAVFGRLEGNFAEEL